jgi:uncharacterized protein DUF1538
MNFALFMDLGHTLLTTTRDVLPIVIVLVVFQVFVLRRPIEHPRRMFVGAACVLVGLALFLIGLEGALFPLGRAMARQLSDPVFVFGSEAPPGEYPWSSYIWVYVFAAFLGFATTVAEPALIAVAMKAETVSAGTVREWTLRVAVGIGVGAGVALGTIRIVTGMPLHLFMAAGYLIIIVQTWLAPKKLVPLAYDSGGVTTSTVTVPLVTALGLGLASTIPGRNPALDGFGLIAFASLFPVMAVLGYGQIGMVLARWRVARSRRKAQKAAKEEGEDLL